MNRLKTASGGYSASYTYSTNGKLLTKSEQHNYTLAYNDAAHKHAATSATGNGPAFSMTYDANGNMVVENGETFVYNGDDQLVSRTSGGVTTTYTYDGKGTLVKKSASDGTWTIYIGGIYEKKNDGSYITYYNAFGRRIVMRTHTGPSDPGTKHFFLSDQLGSTSTVLRATGAVEQSEKYYPYGALRSGGITLTDKKFTGQQEEGTAFGLYDYGARFYSTALGRFISADPVGVRPGDPQSLDRYAYVRNDPLKFVDPSGLSMIIVCGMGQDCEGKGARDYKAFFWYAMAYWVGHEGLSAEAALGQWNALGRAVEAGVSTADQARGSGVGFMSTAEDPKVLAKVVAGEVVGLGDQVGDYAAKIHRAYLSLVGGMDPLDTLVGFSLGGMAVAGYLADTKGRTIDHALLIEPAFNAPGIDNPIADASELPYTKLVTLNGTNPTVTLSLPVYLLNPTPIGPALIPTGMEVTKTLNLGGTVRGAVNLPPVGDCGAHCEHGGDMGIVAGVMTELFAP